VAASTTSQVEGQQFGYQWYLDRAGYFNWDFPGQWVIAVPEADLLVVLSGSIPENQAWNVRILMESLILPAIKSDGPLPSDAEAQAALEQKVAELGQAPESQPVPPLPETASRITGRKILLVANNLGWKYIQLDFPGGAEAQFTLDDGSQPISAPVGLDNVPRVITLGRPEIEPGVILASWGQWKEPDVFSTVIAQENIYFQNQVTFTFTFSDEAVTFILEVPGEGKFEIQGALEP